MTALKCSNIEMEVLLSGAQRAYVFSLEAWIDVLLWFFFINR
jgi:hypothetical protein